MNDRNLGHMIKLTQYRWSVTNRLRKQITFQSHEL